MRMVEEGRGAGRYLPTNESNLFKFLQQKQAEYSWYPWYYVLLSVFASPINRNSSTKLPGREINGSLVISTPACLPALPKSTPFSICTLIN